MLCAVTSLQVSFLLWGDFLWTSPWEQLSTAAYTCGTRESNRRWITCSNMTIIFQWHITGSFFWSGALKLWGKLKWKHHRLMGRERKQSSTSQANKRAFNEFLYKDVRFITIAEWDNRWSSTNSTVSCDVSKKLVFSALMRLCKPQQSLNILNKIVAD